MLLVAEVGTAVAVAVPVVAVRVVVGVGNESEVDNEGVVRLQNCRASCSVVFSKVGHVVDMQETIPWGNLPLKKVCLFLVIS